ncbi:MAG: hypothetical protein NZM27_10940 [Acetobacteraceae bacterium]|nr:hypothetical protein [Acetobacteraceae bacterium]MCX7685032.1 hypothetical protein [Acetobacteraceae bacterium]MDW8398649.1 hypothetical protein [Acetobacteraceae bacterium]
MSGARAAPRRSAPRGGRAASAVPPPWRRWLWVGLIVLAVTLGLPVAHALFGELGAIMLGCLLAGFALGRATAPRKGGKR